MKTDIHPTYFQEATVICSCGNTFKTGSTREHIRVEVCFKCHPLYTGEKRFLDSMGQVDRFEKKQKIAEEYKKKYANKSQKKVEKDQDQPKSLKDLLLEI
ncbi:50S ribosomal protein L31 [Candidatus Roizmanbacteria bacterium RIFCSPLOWO2_02_FULL_37_19]|uniref:Large ribosomal subunit protein bL31 n=1 Tax=Candidatus Roizmanbacteria bacterium RIFCSPHIGHO2_02_FULL_37_24 TaxID=1802037 RepID=A0A1F7GXK8_9BACT|nr:MAG: 50S ribosomal protein L31 [Candidatus Roizmanbacteria bacterium RIFCSPHIGHO2_02_FULL_37_24]OGK33694.1 MAG: 50S ribosomal protein L31 [Candidatus Roizmanbacteria bacterium RIFCSPHIGHO2_12_FULL_37_23]OGK43342.1 MAG: 50S ribosomal protein L31 [Candidatus Roizmanbacteria bacterium RIFCSPLOWO2_01_FULL_37_57]OGK55150.1 MAG: 50S ribosomal protein L31 [Candidatus Roizmanbacteria bacterium RIFCSPLOWO2_02_FULL_37_19]OGK58868.1 MAG: 50S ribosomal protein L31 [Candidatus Roizmanbacteria bacterium R